MTRATITVNLSGHQPNCPLGLLLAPLITSGHDENGHSLPDSHSPIHSHHTVLIGWTRPYNKLGLIQKSGQVRIGDRLVEINGVSVRQWTFEKIVRVLRCFGAGAGAGASGGLRLGMGDTDTSDSIQIKSLGFEVLKDYESGIGYEDRNFRVASGNNSSRRLYCLNTFVRSYSDNTIDVDPNDGNIIYEEEGRPETDNQNENPPKKQLLIARYEIKCNLLIRHYQGNDEEVNWSVWKRYSEFKELHDKLMVGYEWIMNSMNDGRGIRFPSKHVMGCTLYGRLSDRVLKRRQKELEAYWTILQSRSCCQDLFDFGDPASHRYAKDMAEFLHVERYLHSDGTGSITSRSHPPRINRYGVRDTSLELNVSNVSSNSESPPDENIAQLKLDDPTGDELGEIIVKEKVKASPGSASALNASSRSTISRTSTMRKKNRMKRGTAAKPAFQRMLLDDF